MLEEQGLKCWDDKRDMQSLKDVEVMDSCKAFIIVGQCDDRTYQRIVFNRMKEIRGKEHRLVFLICTGDADGQGRSFGRYHVDWQGEGVFRYDEPIGDDLPDGIDADRFCTFVRDTVKKEIDAAVLKPKYDVFISKNSDDQAFADSVVQFLEASGLSVFESKKDLPRIGDTDYSRAIFSALENSKNIIVICSENENGNSSKWVYEEWSWFINEIRSKRCAGQVITIRKGILPGSLDPQLRKYESFDSESYQERILSYLK